MAVTFTLKVQEPFAPKPAPAKLMLFVPDVAVIVPAPQVPVSALGVATINPAGSVSVKPIWLSEIKSGFVTVKLRLVVAFTGIALAPKVMLSVGGPFTVTVAEAPVILLPTLLE